MAMYNAVECDKCKKVARAGNIPLPNALIGLPEPLAPQGWITAFTKADNKHHFCSYYCLMSWSTNRAIKDECDSRGEMCVNTDNISQLTLGELIAKLETVRDKRKPVLFDDRYHPVDVDSWRGAYAELALEYAETGEPLTVEALLVKLRSAVGNTFTGYKGGDYIMSAATPVWIANYGESTGFIRNGDVWTQAVIGVTEQEQCVIIDTKNMVY